MPRISENEIKQIFAANLARILDERGMDGAELARLIGAEKQSIYSWLKMKSFPSANNLQKLVDALRVSSDKLLTNQEKTAKNGYIDLPLLGSIAAGTPIEMLPIDDTFPCPEQIALSYDRLFWLKLNGSSVDRIIPDGYLVLIAPDVKAGSENDLFAVCVNGYDATVKHVRKLANGFELLPDSHDPTFQPRIFNFNDPETEAVTIIGKVVWAAMPFNFS